MGGNLLVRLLRVLAAAWLIVSVLFLLSRSLPAPRLMAAELVRTSSTRQLQASEQRYAQRLGLAVPVFYVGVWPWRWHGLDNQYHHWLRGLTRGSLGYSYRDGRSVAQLLREALAVTLPLVVLALALTGSLAGAAALALARRPKWRRRLMPGLLLLDALPLFVVAMLLLWLLASPEGLALLPAYGLGAAAGQLPGLIYLILPASSLVLAALPGLVLPLTAALGQEQHQPYAVTARAKGAPADRLWHRHLLPNALPPFITRFTDLLPALTAGAVVVEVVFALPGMGRLLLEAAAARDYPVLLGGVLLTAAARLLAWLLADVVSALAYPRLRPTI
ncbi:ABC transporter permease [Hymenobacter sp. B81]|uniref:ABC transporter permease n=1 Tax=Hymenobacter sp. B81 TaxID=3344878 RepID=UPI0037DCAF74